MLRCCVPSRPLSGPASTIWTWGTKLLIVMSDVALCLASSTQTLLLQAIEFLTESARVFKKTVGTESPLTATAVQLNYSLSHYSLNMAVWHQL